LDQYLRLFVNERQDNWYDLLPMAEFQHNNHVHSATQQPLFLLDTGWLPCMGFEPRQNPSGLETVNEFTERMRTAIEEAKSAIRKAQDNMKKYYDQRRTPALDDPITGQKTEDHPPPIVIDGEPEWKVEEILDSRWHQRRFQYLIKWKGYGCEHNSWESPSEVSAPELTAEFHCKHPGAPRHIRHVEFNNIFHSESIALRRSNLKGGVNVRGHLHLNL